MMLHKWQGWYVVGEPRENALEKFCNQDFNINWLRVSLGRPCQ